MGKRVDFSLGMSSISSGDQYGDVFDEPNKPRLPLPHIRMTSPSPQPSLHRGSEDNNSLGKTTSRDSTGSKTGIHKNRFFSRKGRSVTRSAHGDDGRQGTSLEDLEAGNSHGGRNRGFSVFDMPDIPEASGANTAAFVTPPTQAQLNSQTQRQEHEGHGQEQWRSDGPPVIGISRASTGPVLSGNSAQRAPLGQRMDPRTGIISPQAVARDSALERGDLPRQH